MRKHNDLTQKLTEIDLLEEEAIRIGDPDKRYQSYQRLNVELMKINAFYDLKPKERERISIREQRYKERQRSISDDLSREAQRRYPRMIVSIAWDNLGPIVADQEAIKAYNILLGKYCKETNIDR